jgi:hypothetical protein
MCQFEYRRYELALEWKEESEEARMNESIFPAS